MRERSSFLRLFLLLRLSPPGAKLLQSIMAIFHAQASDCSPQNSTVFGMPFECYFLTFCCAVLFLDRAEWGQQLGREIWPFLRFQLGVHVKSAWNIYGWINNAHLWEWHKAFMRDSLWCLLFLMWRLSSFAFLLHPCDWQDPHQHHSYTVHYWYTRCTIRSTCSISLESFDVTTFKAGGPFTTFLRFYGKHFFFHLLYHDGILYCILSCERQIHTLSTAVYAF